METCPRRELRASPRKGRKLPMLHPVGTAPDTAQGTSPLTQYPPRPKGSRGRSHSFPPHVSVSAPSPSRVKMNRGKPLPLIAFRLIFCMYKNPVKGLSGTADPLWVEDKERPLTGSQPQTLFLQSRTETPFLLLPHGECPRRVGVGGKAPLLGQGISPLSGLRGRQPPPSESLKTATA